MRNQVETQARRVSWVPQEFYYSLRPSDLTIMNFLRILFLTLILGLVGSQQGSPVWAITFVPPNQEPPQQTRGGASRGDVTFVPPNGSPPVNTSGAGSRDYSFSLTALLPSQQYGQTSQSHPSFLVYIPATSARLAFFSVLSESGQHHYQSYLPINEQGVVQVQLPKQAPELEEGKTYQWHFALITEERLRPDSPRVSGWVTRVATPSDVQELQAQSKGRQSLALAQAYGRQGIWYDALSTLASLRQERPAASEIYESWDSLLDQVGLAAIANEPFFDLSD